MPGKSRTIGATASSSWLHWACRRRHCRRHHYSASPRVSHKRVFTLIRWQPGSANTGFCSIWAISSCEFRASIARTPFCAILWRSPNYRHHYRHQMQLMSMHVLIRRLIIVRVMPIQVSSLIISSSVRSSVPSDISPFCCFAVRHLAGEPRRGGWVGHRAAPVSDLHERCRRSSNSCSSRSEKFSAPIKIKLLLPTPPPPPENHKYPPETRNSMGMEVFLQKNQRTRWAWNWQSHFRP